MADFMKTVSKIIDVGISCSGKLMSKKKAAEPISDSEFSYLPKTNEKYYTAGFGKAIMLPSDIDSKKYYIAGYGENNPARGVIDPQYAHALWLDDNSGRGAVLMISLDAVGMLNNDINEAKKRLRGFLRITGCRNVNIFCTHDHAGIDTMGIWGPLPKTGKDPEFMEIVFEAIIKAAKEAYYYRKDGELFLGTTEVPDMQEDIRTPIVYSKTLTRFRFVPNDGTNEIWWLNFASHSESLQGCNHLVSADFPCYLREKIKTDAKADVIYGVGAIGGMISMDIPEERQLINEHRLIESTRKIGYKLADYAISIKNDKKLAPCINFIRKEFYAEADNPVLVLAGSIGILNADKYTDLSASKNWMLKSEMTYYEIGGKKILFLPCELFPELAFGGALSAKDSATGKGSEVNPRLLSEIAGDDELLIFGLSNDELGYVLPPNDFLLNENKPYLDKVIDRHGRRHYEETNSLGPKTAAVIADTFENIMKTVNEVKAKIL